MTWSRPDYNWSEHLSLHWNTSQAGRHHQTEIDINQILDFLPRISFVIFHQIMTSLTRLGRFIILINICLCSSSESTETRTETSGDSGEEPVLELTDVNFVTVVGSTRYIMVEFSSPSCGHCRSFAPQYRQSGALSLVQISRDTLLWLVESYYAGICQDK